MQHVLWIGGPPCAGKTSVARLLGGRHDLRVYDADAHTWEHHDKAVARRYPAALRGEAMTPDEAWLGESDTMVAHSLAANEERCALMVEDLEALPPTPLTIAEGTPLFPWLIADRLADADRAVWLIPTPEFQRARLLERPGYDWKRTSDPTRALANRIERERRVGERIEQAARSRSLSVICVDGSQGLNELAESVGQHFAATIAAGPRASDRARRRALRREENLQVHRQVSTFFERRPGAGDPAASPVPFACECGEAGCQRIVHTTLDQAGEAFASADRFLVSAGSGAGR